MTLARPLPLAALAALLALVLPAASTSGLRAQGRSAAPLLVLPASARAAALGDAVVASGGAGRDAAVLFANPAQLAGLAGTSAALSVERYLASSTLGAFAAAHSIGRVVVGGGVLALDYPDSEEILPDEGGATGTPTGARISAHDLVAGVAVAAGGERLRTGAMVQYVGQSLPGTSGGTAALDVGAAGRVASGGWGRVDVAAAVQHLGGRITTGTTSAPLPRTWRAGASLETPAVAGARWTLLTELVGTRDADLAARAGLEGTWRLAGLELAARGGWAQQPEGALARPLSLGAGLQRQRLWLDYAWRRFGDTGDTHRVGVRWQR